MIQAIARWRRHLSRVRYNRDCDGNPAKPELQDMGIMAVSGR